MRSVAVLIPSFNEEATIRAAVDSAFAAGAAEVVVADGGSSDGTVAIAEEAGARIVRGSRMRAQRLNQAAASTAAGILLFLHADSILPPAACAAVAEAVERRFVFGGFRLRFLEPSWRLAFAAALINFRTLISRAPWGDQGQFVAREEFLAGGGFREIPIMEDYELAMRMRSRVRSVLLPQLVLTSGRRFLQLGLVRTSAINWCIVAAWRAGVPAETLRRWYDRKAATPGQ